MTFCHIAVRSLFNSWQLVAGEPGAGEPVALLVARLRRLLSKNDWLGHRTVLLIDASDVGAYLFGVLTDLVTHTESLLAHAGYAAYTLQDV